jgi:hypothetical protein
VPALKDVKAGQKLTLLWQETKGQKSIVGVKPETKSEAQAQPKAETKPVPAAQKNPASNQPSSNRK